MTRNLHHKLAVERVLTCKRFYYQSWLSLTKRLLDDCQWLIEKLICNRKGYSLEMLVKKLIGARHTSLIAFLEALTVAIVVWIANDQTRTVRMVISEQADLCIAGCLPSFSSLLDVLNVLLIHAENVGESFEILFTYLSGFVLGIDQEWTGY